MRKFLNLIFIKQIKSQELLKRAITSLHPGSPGSIRARVTPGVIIREVYGHRAVLIVLQPAEEILHHRGERRGHVVSLLWILFDVEQPHGTRRIVPELSQVEVVVLRPREPDATSWVSSQQLPVGGSDGSVNGHIEAGLGPEASVELRSQV